MSKIVIISYTFPPQAGVGGRRWAKFCKYFVKRGADVQVLTGPITKPSKSWMDDTHSYQDKISKVNNPRGAALKVIPETISEKIKYRLALQRAKRKTKGNYFDSTVSWTDTLLPEIKKCIESGAEVIVASAGPFSYLHDLLELKKQFPKVKLIADFRDPWTNNKTAYGYSDIEPNRYEYEQSLEVRVVEQFDAVVSVAPPMTDYFQALHKGSKETKFLTIPNGFDTEDLVNLQKSTRIKSDKIRIGFVGTVYNKTKRHINAFVDALLLLGETEFEIIFCGEMSNEIRALLIASNVTCLEPVSHSEAQKMLSKTDIGLLFLTDDLTYSFSTKFCEYIQNEIPIWAISEDGITPSYIQDNGIGHHSKPNAESIMQGFDWWKSNIDSCDYASYSSSDFNVENLSAMYLNLIDELRQP
jgi:glycosyltransferase involved in cell wall biosynthesis